MPPPGHNVLPTLAGCISVTSVLIDEWFTLHLTHGVYSVGSGDWIIACIYHDSAMRNSVLLTRPPCPFTHPPQPLVFFTLCVSGLFLEGPLSGITQYAAFSN